MSFSNYLETEVLDHVFGGNAYTAPATLYLALHTASPAEDGSGTEVSTSGTAYARQTVTFTVSGNTATTDAVVEYSTATSSFGTVTHVGIWDASTAGNLLAYAALTSSKAIDTGDVFRVPTGDLDITLD
jgi:predicted metal-binding membrane protein